MAWLEGVSRNFIKSAKAAPYLSRDSERQLARRWRENKDEGALHELSHAHMRLVMAMAVKLRNYGLPLPELIQEGHVGLLEAAARFDPEREVRFSTYAAWWIRASMQDFILRNWSIVRGGTSSAQKSLFFNLRRLRAKIARGDREKDKVQTYEELALALGVRIADVEMMDVRLSAPDASLNAPVSEAEDGVMTERGDLFADAGPLPDIVAEHHIDGERRSQMLKHALKQLTVREQRIVQGRKLSDTSLTLEALGRELGISKERVRQIENRALEKLRQYIAPDVPAAADR